MKTLRKYLATPALAFFLAFAVAGTPNAPATAIVPSSGQAHAAAPAVIPAVVWLSGFLAGSIAGGYVFNFWVAHLETPVANFMVETIKNAGKVPFQY